MGELIPSPWCLFLFSWSLCAYRQLQSSSIQLFFLWEDFTEQSQKNFRRFMESVSLLIFTIRKLPLLLASLFQCHNSHWMQVTSPPPRPEKKRKRKVRQNRAWLGVVKISHTPQRWDSNWSEQDYRQLSVWMRWSGSFHITSFVAFCTLPPGWDVRSLIRMYDYLHFLPQYVLIVSLVVFRTFALDNFLTNLKWYWEKSSPYLIYI